MLRVAPHLGSAIWSARAIGLDRDDPSAGVGAVVMADTGHRRHSETVTGHGIDGERFANLRVG